MLGNASITTILPVTDMTRATAFYRDRLGLQDLGDVADGNHALQTGSGATIELMSAEAGAQSKHTAASFGVDDIEKEITDLEARGVTFEDYDLPGLKTVNHVAVQGSDKAAWFSDPEGNILCLHQEASN
jgi:predicted enzyme related to lactoylglutathione lyase